MEKREMSNLAERTSLANIAGFIISIGGLFIAWRTGNQELVGVIIGAGLTWLFKTKSP